MDCVNQSECRGRLVIVCGMTGSGKTTLALTISAQTGAIRMSPDDWMVDLSIDIWDSQMRGQIEALQWKITQDLLRQNCVVIIEWGTWGRSERDQLRNGARALGAAVELRFLDIAPDIAWQRVRERGMEQIAGSRAITRADIDEWFAIFEPPGQEEMELFDPIGARL